MVGGFTDGDETRVASAAAAFGTPGGFVSHGAQARRLDSQKPTFLIDKRAAPYALEPLLALVRT